MWVLLSPVFFPLQMFVCSQKALFHSYPYQVLLTVPHVWVDKDRDRIWGEGRGRWVGLGMNLSFISSYHVTLGKILTPLSPSFPICEMKYENDDTRSVGLQQGSNETAHVTSLARFLTHNENSVDSYYHYLTIILEVLEAPCLPQCASLGGHRV